MRQALLLPLLSALLFLATNPNYVTAIPEVPYEAKVGGRTSPSGVDILCDLPGDLHQKNVAARGLGCCVFRSIDHAARWQNIPALIGFPEWLISKGIEGGGYPAKVDKLIPQICKDRGYPVPDYVQVEDTDVAILKLASKTRRMICTTYSRSPTKRYGGSHIDHMINLSHFDDDWVAAFDNNFIGDANYEWMSPSEFLRVANEGKKYWAIIFLNPPPTPPPTN